MDLETEDEKKAYIEETKCTSILDKIIVQVLNNPAMYYYVLQRFV